MPIDDFRRAIENLAGRIRALEVRDIVTKLYIGLRDGWRAGIVQYMDDDDNVAAVVEVANAYNEPIASFGSIDDGDPTSAWANVGYAGYPGYVHTKVVAPWDRPILETDYTPADVGDWTADPETVRIALDQLAARVKALGG